MLVTLAQVTPMPHTPWGGLLATYFTLIGLPSGMTLALWWHRSRWPTAGLTLDWRAGWATMALLGASGVLLTVDLGRPERFHLMLTQFGNWDSPISLGAKIIAVKTALLGLALYLLWRRRAASSDLPEPARARGPAAYLDTAVMWLLGAASIALAVYPVTVLARTWISPLAATSGSALLYLVTSLLMGCSALVITHAWDRSATEEQHAAHRQVTLVLLMAYAVALALAAVSVANGPADEALDAVLTGEWAPLFYSCTIGIGLLVPIGALVLAGNRRWSRLASAAAVLVGAGSVRYLIFAA